MTIVLASASAIRRRLLTNAGIDFRAETSDVDEAAVKAELKLPPGPLAMHLAEAKAIAVSRNHGSALVVGADQVLALGEAIFDKPQDSAEARSQLLALRGKAHELHSAAACARDGKIVWTHHDVAHLTMRNFSDAFIGRYLELAPAAITSSVGAYKLEETGIQLFDKITGDYFTILGLPLLPLLAFLRERGEVRT